DDRIARRVDQPHVLHARARERVLRPLRRAPDVRGVFGQRADARDGEVLLELVEIAITVDVDVVDDVVNGSMICHASPSRRALPSRSSFTRWASTLSRATGTSGRASDG